MSHDFEKRYSYLWDGSEPGWVLVKISDSKSGYLPFNRQTSRAVCIEIDEDNLAVCQRMRAAGCEIVESIMPRMATVTPLADSKGNDSAVRDD
jgi:hypothetical protein